MELHFCCDCTQSSYMPKIKKSQKVATKMSNTIALEDMVRILVQQRTSREEEIATERKLCQVKWNSRRG